jgi:sarcosine oxidase, subunit gamma
MSDSSRLVELDGRPCFLAQAAGARLVFSLKSWAVSPNLRAAPEHPELPLEVGETRAGPPKVLCTGPGEWLLLHPPTEASALQGACARWLSSPGLALVDLTAGLVVLEVSGSQVREVFRKSCGLDFEPRHFSAGQCARTRFAQIPVVIDCLDAGSAFELYVARSYGAYVLAWLEDASKEFGFSR